MSELSEVTVQIEIIEWKGQRLQLQLPLVISVQRDEANQLMIAEDSSLNLHVFAHSEAELRQEINEQIVFMWNQYVESDEAKLAKDARKLREVLRERLKKVG